MKVIHVVWEGRWSGPPSRVLALAPALAREGVASVLVVPEDGADWIYVEAWPDAAGLNEDGFLEAILAVVEDGWGAPIEAPVARTLGGEPGYLATFRFAFDDGSEGIAFDVLAMHDNVGWDVTLLSAPGVETQDFKLLEQFLATFAYIE